MKLIVLTALLALLTTVSCDVEKVKQLEKENQEMKAELLKRRAAESATADYDLRAKCSKDAKEFFNEGWRSDKDTILLDYSNHYNKRMNKCFITVEHHFPSSYSKDVWINDISVWDVYENSKYASLAETHETVTTPNFEIKKDVQTCEVTGKKCTTVDEFSSLMRPYLSD